MPELRARSRTPSTSRSGGATPSQGSPRKGAPEQKGCLSNWCSKMTPQRKQQAISAGWFLLAGLIVAGGICTVHHRIDFKVTGSLSERLAFTLRCLMLSGLTLASAIKYVALKRFTSGAINPTSGNERVVDIPNRILQNTLEQFVIHSAVLLALASYLSADHMKFIPLFVAFFVIGRIFFYLGYPSKRCFGFALGWLPTGISFWVTIYFMYTKGLAAF